MSKQIVDTSDDVLQPVRIFWSEKYACPIYKVAGKMYAPSLEDVGYFDELEEAAPTPAQEVGK